MAIDAVFSSSNLYSTNATQNHFSADTQAFGAAGTGVAIR